MQDKYWVCGPQLKKKKKTPFSKKDVCSITKGRKQNTNYASKVWFRQKMNSNYLRTFLGTRLYCRPDSDMTQNTLDYFYEWIRSLLPESRAPQVSSRACNDQCHIIIIIIIIILMTWYKHNLSAALLQTQKFPVLKEMWAISFMICFTNLQQSGFMSW